MKNVAIVCGGDSGEFEVSVKSAAVVKRNLDPQKYNAYVMVVSKKGWYCLLDDGSRIDIDKNDFSIMVNGKKIVFDVAFNAVHGEPGENGPLSGYLELLGIPCTSSDLTTCALTFHKDFCKRVVQSYEVKVSPSVLINEGESYDAQAIVAELGLPLFVKPTRNGSSVGVSKVHRIEEFEPAIKTALAAGSQVMCEKFVPGREFGCGAMKVGKRMMVFPLTEIVPKNEFFDYEAKYNGLSREVCPAEVPDSLASEIQSISCRLYRHLGCKGLVRMDYISAPALFPGSQHYPGHDQCFAGSQDGPCRRDGFHRFPDPDH